MLTQVPEQSKVFRHEAFGPVAAINAYDSLDDAIERVNASDYGLQAGIFTRDLDKAFHAAASYLADRIPGATSLVIPDSGHHPQRVAPGAIAAAIGRSALGGSLTPLVP